MWQETSNDISRAAVSFSMHSSICMQEVACFLEVTSMDRSVRGKEVAHMQGEGTVPVGLGMGRVDDVDAPGAGAAGIQRLLLYCR